MPALCSKSHNFSKKPRKKAAVIYTRPPLTMMQMHTNTHKCTDVCPLGKM